MGRVYVPEGLMKLIQTVVSSVGFREHATHPDRVALLAELARLCASEDGQLLVIPAGFLTAASEAVNQSEIAT